VLICMKRKAGAVDLCAKLAGVGGGGWGGGLALSHGKESVIEYLCVLCLCSRLTSKHSVKIQYNSSYFFDQQIVSGDLTAPVGVRLGRCVL